MARSGFFSKLFRTFTDRSENLKNTELPLKQAGEPEIPTKLVVIETDLVQSSHTRTEEAEVEVVKETLASPAEYDLSLLPENFDPEIYLKLNPDLGTSIDPIAHYLNHGHKESWRIIIQPEEVSVIPVEYDLSLLPENFDPEIYLKLNPDLGTSIDPIAHYLNHGHKESWRIITLPEEVSTSPVEYDLSLLPENFDPEVYLKLNPDLDASIDPIAHYLNHGHKESWRIITMPEKASASPVEYDLSLLPENFDPEVYLELNPDLDTSIDPIAHYLNHGHKESWRIITLPEELSTSPVEYDLSLLPENFDPEVYLKLNPDLDASIDPIAHYLTHGHKESWRIITMPEEASASPVEYDLSLLPENFDPELYLKLNPDLCSSIDPIAHYLNYGHQESWRIVTLPEIRYSKNRAFDSTRDTVMVVSHEASRSGAPILALNLVERLSSRYNVVALLLGDGALLGAFEEAAVATMASSRLKNNVPYAHPAIKHLCSKFEFKFALVNSMECRVVLEPLARHFVPAIPLIHEFASAYPNSSAVFSDARLWSSDQVFSADVTWESAKDSCPALKSLTAHIIPQGRCVLPAQLIVEKDTKRESEYLRGRMRPAADTERKFVVLGAGYVNFRKGADLFIQCAIKTMLTPGGDRFRFVWIGKGYNPDVEDGYSVYLADQIKRSGLQERFVMLDETSAIETAYEEADLLFISSRLDPLPNVAIDAFDARLPVLCFDKATGISDFLSSCGLRDSCIADYLDVDSAVQKIFALANSNDLYEQAVNNSHEASKAYFDMDKYVAELELVGLDAARRAEQEKRDVETILESDLFDASAQDVRLHVRSWASGITSQPLHEDFKPDVYVEEHGLEIPGCNPLADYIRMGCPRGSWNTSA